MGVDTRGRIKGKVSHHDILNYIKEKIDPNATMHVTSEEYGDMEEKDFIKEIYDNSGKWIITSGFIDFTSKNGNERSLFYMYDNTNSYENLDYYKPLGLEKMVKSETTYLNLRHRDESPEILRDIVSQFGGGWVDDNDCDSEPYYAVPAKENPEKVPPVIHVKMKDIYEKFGGIVVIDDYNS